MSMGYTQADLDNLKAALVSGATEVHVGDRIIKYRSQAAIIEAIRLVQQELSSQTVVSNIVPASYSKGSK